MDMQIHKGASYLLYSLQKYIAILNIAKYYVDHITLFNFLLIFP